MNLSDANKHKQEKQMIYYDIAHEIANNFNNRENAILCINFHKEIGDIDDKQWDTLFIMICDADLKK